MCQDLSKRVVVFTGVVWGHTELAPGLEHATLLLLMPYSCGSK